MRLVLSFLLISLAAHALAAPRTKPEPKDSLPQLLTTTGGAPKWKNDQELRRYAAAGDAHACFALGSLLLKGDDQHAADPQAALPWLEKAAAGDIADASFRLGKMYHDGTGVTRDYAQALVHYRKAAQHGVAEAQHNIGAMLVSARGVKRNYVEGLAWLIVAGKSGAVSSAEVQVRDRLAKRPADILAAEERAKEILQDLEQATIVGVSNGRSTTTIPYLPPPEVTAPAVKSVITTPMGQPALPVSQAAPLLPPPTLPVPPAPTPANP